MSSELNENDLLAGLLQYNYLPHQHDNKEELPPIFNSVLLTPAVGMALRKVPYRGKSGYDVLPYRRTRHPNIPRMMGIPHPRAYIELVFLLVENWNSHISKQCQSPNSQIEFCLHEDGRIIVQKYNQVDRDGDSTDGSPLVSFGKEYRLKTDITNFFHSIYSHSLPWALVGHKVAKKKKGREYSQEWFNRLDAAVRLCQRNETKGVSIGPATSNILSEIILFKVDESLRNAGFEFSRYIDDYKVYTKTSEQANAFLVLLTNELGSYALNLNPRKTFTTKLSIPDKEDWIGEINLFLELGGQREGKNKKRKLTDKLSLQRIKMIINKAVSLGKEYPDGSVLKYALSAILNHGFEDNDAETFFEDAILQYAYHFPTIVPLIHRVANLFVYTKSHAYTEQRLLLLLRKSLIDRQSDNAVWCLYYLLKASGQLEADDWAKIWKTEDPMVMLMGYVFARKRKLEHKSLNIWAQAQINGLKTGSLDEYDIDKHWLLLYQLYYDGVIGPFYVDANDCLVFETLKKKKVSFINFEHGDMRTYAEIMFGNVTKKKVLPPF